MKSARAFASRSSSLRYQRPAAIAALSGRKGDKPPAIRSALTKWSTPASLGRYSRANVVLPAPFGPAMTTQRGWPARFISLAQHTRERGLAPAPGRASPQG